MIIIITGASGAGKSTLAKLLEDRLYNARRIISFTSREPRPNEMDGVDYHFRHRDFFNSETCKRSTIEIKKNYGEYYASCKPLSSVKYNIYVADPEGSKLIYDRFKSKAVVISTEVTQSNEARLTDDRLVLQEKETTEALMLCQYKISDPLDNPEEVERLARSITQFSTKIKN